MLGLVADYSSEEDEPDKQELLAKDTSKRDETPVEVPPRKGLFGSLPTPKSSNQPSRGGLFSSLPPPAEKIKKLVQFRPPVPVATNDGDDEDWRPAHKAKKPDSSAQRPSSGGLLTDLLPAPKFQVLGGGRSATVDIGDAAKSDHPEGSHAPASKPATATSATARYPTTGPAPPPGGPPAPTLVHDVAARYAGDSAHLSSSARLPAYQGADGGDDCGNEPLAFGTAYRPSSSPGAGEQAASHKAAARAGGSNDSSVAPGGHYYGQGYPQAPGPTPPPEYASGHVSADYDSYGAQPPPQPYGYGGVNQRELTKGYVQPAPGIGAAQHVHAHPALHTATQTLYAHTHKHLDTIFPYPSSRFLKALHIGALHG
eukprot:jgi/Mesvir1/27518/Mv07280-RA.1